MRISLLNAASWMGCSFHGSGWIEGWSVDSRTAQPGDMFFALRGEHHDGHDYVGDVTRRGAFAVVDRDLPAELPLLFRVDNTLLALQRLAHQARRNWGGKVVAVTGSAGKTTTKDVISHFLATQIPTGKTAGNFNNHVGLPLSILCLPDSCRVAVLEVGMNHAGEIRQLAGIAEPDIAVVTNVGYAHVEFFNSIEGIALAKRELVESLQNSGIAVLNADDERVAAFSSIHRGRSITYGFSESAEICGRNLELISDGARFDCGGTFQISLSGRHGALNALAGIATATAFGIHPAELVEAARTLPTPKMRGERVEKNGFVIINDAYNANPEAMRSMLDVLAETPGRRHVAILGEMLELGEQSEALHRAIGRYAAQKKIDLLVGVRGAAHAILDGAVAAGMPSAATHFFSSSEQAGGALKHIVEPGDAILFKGSRGVGVEKALEKLLEASN